MHRSPSLEGFQPTTTPPTPRQSPLRKAATGIAGLDRLTGGGLPEGRTTLVCGAAGSGKTMLAMEFIVRGAQTFDEPGVYLAFEETADELAANAASIGFDLRDLVERGRLVVDHVRLDPSELRIGGSFDLEGLFIRLGHAIDEIGAKRVAIDTVEVLFGALPDPGLLRPEIARLFRWLKDRGVTAVVTGERGTGTLTRHGLEEYVSDCVIALDHRVHDELSVRRLRIVKYRGSPHGTDEYPFLIDEDGISVFPLSAVGLDYEVSTDMISTGITGLDAMLGGSGIYRGSSVLVSGTAGTGKTSIAASFVDAACARGERCVYFSFEESPGQIVRNMASIGIDLQRWVDDGSLHFASTRPTSFGLEMHLSRMQRTIDRVAPMVVVVDPVTTFDAIGEGREIASTVTRLLDVCRSRGITSVFASLSSGGSPLEATAANISSVADVWLLLRDTEEDGERNRVVYVLKARGTAHSNQVREFTFTDRGIELIPAYVGADGVKTGSARLNQEARQRLDDLVRRQEIDRARQELDLHRARHAAAIAALEAELAAHETRMRIVIEQYEAEDEMRGSQQQAIARRRYGATSESGGAS